jgi:hypothetical protein
MLNTSKVLVKMEVAVHPSFYMAQRGKRFFFEKKNQKTFIPGRALSAASNSDSDPSVRPSLRSLSKEQSKSAKVFCFFFKKEVLP